MTDRLFGIPSYNVGACELPWGHDGDMHANAGDGFYARDFLAEHRTRQRQLFRDAVIRECAGALGQSGDYYIEQGEGWLLNHFNLHPQAAPPEPGPDPAPKEQAATLSLTLHLVKQEAGPQEDQLSCMFCMKGHGVEWETGYRPEGTGKLIGAGVCEGCRSKLRVFVPRAAR